MLASFIEIDIDNTVIQTMTITNMAMGFLFYVPEDFGTMLLSDGTERVHSEIFEQDIDQELYYVEIEGRRQPVFGVYRIETDYTKEELLQLDPGLIYIDKDMLATFVLKYAEEPMAGLSRNGQEEFVRIMDEYVDHIENEFILDGLT